MVNVLLHLSSTSRGGCPTALCPDHGQLGEEPSCSSPCLSWSLMQLGEAWCSHSISAGCFQPRSPSSPVPPPEPWHLLLPPPDAESLGNGPTVAPTTRMRAPSLSSPIHLNAPATWADSFFCSPLKNDCLQTPATSSHLPFWQEGRRLSGTGVGGAAPSACPSPSCLTLQGTLPGLKQRAIQMASPFRKKSRFYSLRLKPHLEKNITPLWSAREASVITTLPFFWPWTCLQLMVSGKM